MIQRPKDDCKSIYNIGFKGESDMISLKDITFLKTS